MGPFPDGKKPAATPRPRPPNRTTIHDLAAIAGVGKSTVSRVLTADPRVAAATRERVLDAIAASGYRRDLYSSQLGSLSGHHRRAAQVPTLALLLPAPRERSGPSGRIGDHDSVPGAVRDQAALLGYRIEAVYLTDYADSASVQRMLLSRGLRALLVGPLFGLPDNLTLDWSQFIAVAYSSADNSLPIHGVSGDKYAGVELAWRKAVDHGFRRIGAVLLRHPLPIRDDQLRRAAVHACQTELFRDLPRLPTFEYTIDDPLPPAGLARWLDSEKPDCVLGFTAWVGWAVQLSGRRIPEDTAFITLHRQDNESQWAGVPNEGRHVGTAAVDLLHQLIRSHSWGIPPARVAHLVEPEWVDGPSLPAGR